MQRLAEELGPAAALVCVSCDSGFTVELLRAASRGCTTVAVTRPVQDHRRHPEYLPPRLFAAAGRCLLWDSAWVPDPKQAGEEAEWARRAGLQLPAEPAKGGAVEAWRAGQGYYSLLG